MNSLFEEESNDIRPSRLDEYIGQTEVKQNIDVFIKSALFSFLTVFLATILIIFKPLNL